MVTSNRQQGIVYQLYYRFLKAILFEPVHVLSSESTRLVVRSVAEIFKHSAYRASVCVLRSGVLEVASVCVSHGAGWQR